MRSMISSSERALARSDFRRFWPLLFGYAVLWLCALPLSLWSRLQAGEALDGFRPEDVLGEARRGLSLLYATDTRPVPDMVRLGRECDLMVLEGMFGDPEKDERARVTHHMTMREAAEIARDAQPARLWLTHFSPATPHPEEYLEEMQTLFPRLQMGECVLKETLNFA